MRVNGNDKKMLNFTLDRIAQLRQIFRSKRSNKI
jgi:hypothetical protein